MGMRPCVFVLDDDASFTRALSCLLDAEGFTVRSWTSAAAFLAEHDSDSSGCLLTDLQMPEMSGLELQKRLLERNSARPIIFITGRGEMTSTVEGMRAGAVTFLPKPVRRDALLAALDEALQKEAAMRSIADERQRILGLMSMLTMRERQVLKYVAQGYLNKQIAAQLGAAEKTVKVHRGRLMRKLQTRSVPTLVRMLDCCEAAPLVISSERTAAFPAVSSLP